MLRTTEGRVVDIIEADMVTGEVMIEIGWSRELRIIKAEDLVAADIRVRPPKEYFLYSSLFNFPP